MKNTDAQSILVMDEKLKAKHVKFCKRHVELLPAHHQDKDPNRLAIIFYSLNGMALLGSNVAEEFEYSRQWLRSCYLKIGAFSGFGVCSVRNAHLATTVSLPNTLFGMMSLMLMDDTEFFDVLIDRDSVAFFVSSCQLPNGSFVSFLDQSGYPSKVDSHDLRFCYIAVAILYFIGCRTEAEFSSYINVPKLIEFVLLHQCSFGGFGDGDEPHGGYTSCALSTLSLLGKLSHLPKSSKDKTLHWLATRQVSDNERFDLELNDDYDPDDYGGINGRDNKLADTCYAFWCLNSLIILEPENWQSFIDVPLIRGYLLRQTQNTVIGGFAKNDQDDPDIYHTMMGISALKLIDNEIDGVQCLPKLTVSKFKLC